MKILDFQDLPKSLLKQLPVTAVLDGDPPWGSEILRSNQKLGIPYSSYRCVYAVESGEIVSQIEVYWLTLTTTDGVFPVAGIANVATRPLAQGRGWASALLEEVHRREVDRGASSSFLWTHRSWGAHRLYERLGYVDVYSPPASLKRIPTSVPRKPPAGYRWRICDRRDADRLDRLLVRANQGRIGFIPRFPRSFYARFAIGWRRPDNHRILFQGSQPVGFVHLSHTDPWSISANEVVVVGSEHTRPMLQALESTASGRWLALETTTFVADAAVELRDRGFSTYPGRTER